MEPITCLPLGAVAVGAQAWRYRGHVRLTVVAKVSFDLPEVPTAGKEARGVLRVSAADPLAGAERGEASELAPYLPRGEGVLIGSAYVPRGERVACRFGVARSGSMIFDRRIWASAPPSTQAIVRVPLVHESTLALVDVRDPNAPRAFAPMAPPMRGLSADVLELSDDFAWESLLTAPPTQRAPGFFSGDETLLLEHVSQKIQRFEVTLPGVRVEARVHDGALGEPFALAADLLRVEPDRGRVSLTFRASVPLASERGVKVAARLLVRGRPDPAWPANERAWTRSGGASTAAIDMAEVAPKSLPFKGARPGGARVERAPAPLPGAPFGAPAAPAPPVQEGDAISTLELATPKRPAKQAPAAPAPAPPPPPVPALVSASPAIAPSPPAPSPPAPLPKGRGERGEPLALPPPPPGLVEFGLLPLGARAPEADAAPRLVPVEPTLGALLLKTIAADAARATGASRA